MKPDDPHRPFTEDTLWFKPPPAQEGVAPMTHKRPESGPLGNTDNSKRGRSESARIDR